MIYQDNLDASALEQYASALNARARQANAQGRLSAAELRDRILSCRGRCEWCGASLAGCEFELDHVISLNKQGGNAAANLAVACPDCNRRKGRKHPARFAAEIYRETGRTTELVTRIFQHFAMQPLQQSSLFKPEDCASPDEIALDEMSPARPYRWSGSQQRRNK